MSSVIVPLAEGRFAVEMSEEDWAEGEASGEARDVENQLHPLRHQTHGAEISRSREYSVRGGRGEKAVCIWLGVRYGGKGILGEVDIAGRYEVKSSAHPCMILNGQVSGVYGKGDDPSRVYIGVQVVDEGRRCILIGWSAGHDVMTPDRWANHFRKNPPRPCYMVEAGHLNPMTSLPGVESFPNCYLFRGCSSEGTKDAECHSNQPSPSPSSP